MIFEANILCMTQRSTVNKKYLIMSHHTYYTSKFDKELKCETTFANWTYKGFCGIPEDSEINTHEIMSFRISIKYGFDQ